MTCPVRRCGGELVVEKVHVQDVTHDIAHTLRCTRNWRHKFFSVVKVGSLLRLAIGRWERAPISKSSH